MSMAIAKTLLSTLELREGSTITESEIAALKKRWRPRGALARKDSDKMFAEQQALQDALPMRVSDEQSKRGLDYLRKLLLRKDGEVRNTKLTREQDIHFNSGHAMVLRTLDHFLFTGFHEDTNHFGETVSLHPIYRAVACDGSWFEYIARPWVGGRPSFGRLFEVLE